MPAVRLSTLALSLVLCIGCASYTPAPLDVREIAQSRMDKCLDPETVAASLERLSPDYQWDRITWNALTLFAAALATNPEAAMASADLQSREAAAGAARVAPGPSFGLATEYALNALESSPWLFGVLADLPVDTGGRRRARLEAADIALLQAQQDYGQAIWRVRMALRRAMLDRQSNADELAQRVALLSLRQTQFNTTLRRVEAGEIPRAELERVRGDLAAAQETLSVARASNDRSLIDLAAAVGVRPEALAGLAIEPSAPVGELPAGLPERAFETALDNRSEVLRAISDYDQAESDYRAAVAAQWPSVHIAAGYTWERGLKKIPAGMTLAMPSWDLNAAAIRAAHAARLDAGARLESKVAEVTAEVRVAQSDYQAARVAVTLAEQGLVPAAARLADQANRELALGGIDRADWAAAQAGLAQARIDLLRAQRQARAAFLTLEGALQSPLAGPETSVGIGLKRLAG
jgi:outer membrane protein TolC